MLHTSHRRVLQKRKDLTFTEDDSYYFTNWQKHTGRFEEYLAEFRKSSQQPQRCRGHPAEMGDERGACYYVGRPWLVP